MSERPGIIIWVVIGYRTVYIYQNSLNSTLKIAEFYCKLDPSKANFKLKKSIPEKIDICESEIPPKGARTI